MPDKTDDVLHVELDGSELPPTSEAPEMEPAVANLMVQQLTQTGIVAQNNFVTVQKVFDYDYAENKRMVTLDEAVGVREVASKTTPGGPSPATV